MSIAELYSVSKVSIACLLCRNDGDHLLSSVEARTQQSR